MPKERGMSSENFPEAAEDSPQIAQMNADMLLKGVPARASLNVFRVADFNLDAAMHYADIRAALEAAGKPIGPLDLLIAGQARSLGATLVTANAGEFKRVKGLKIQAWK